MELERKNYLQITFEKISISNEIKIVLRMKTISKYLTNVVFLKNKNDNTH